MKLDTAGDVHIGVDVSKAKLDVYVPATEEGARPTAAEVGNDIEGFRRLRDVARRAKAGVRVAYADALRVRQFARAEGRLSKNDSIDAALIPRFADKIGVRILDERDVDSVELKRRAKFRQAMIDSRTAIIRRIETETDAEMRRMPRGQVPHLDRIIRKAGSLCIETVRRNGDLNGKLARFTAVGGVGDVTAISILASLPEIGKLPDAKLNRLVGLAPEERQGGTREWRRRIRGGRKDVRNALYMASVAAITWNSRLGAYYPRRDIPTSGPSSRRCESSSHRSTESPATRTSPRRPNPSQRRGMRLQDERGSRHNHVSGFGFPLLPHTPPALLSFPCSDAQGMQHHALIQGRRKFFQNLQLLPCLGGYHWLRTETSPTAASRTAPLVRPPRSLPRPRGGTVRPQAPHVRWSCRPAGHSNCRAHAY